MPESAHCSQYSQLYLNHAKVRVGRFSCPASSDDFASAGAITLPTLVFPATPTYICKSSGGRFLSDASKINIYDGSSSYERQVCDPRGDHCHWLELDSEVFFNAIEAHPLKHFRISDKEIRLDQLLSNPGVNLMFYRMLQNLKAQQISAEAGFEQILILLAVLFNNAVPDKQTAQKVNKRKRWRALAEAAQVAIARQPEKNQSISELANVLHTSEFHLCRVFKNIMGISVHQYRKLLRINLGIEQLAKETSITEIAMSLGFASPAHFSDVIKKGLGMSPRQIRKQLLV
ncbi:helix-turn-helix domain-containing protein [Planctobacterium marinum]|uniref:HTH araC/xylS-type domain-containing protein n=1 Tax=Planctobacterium marinum TaxID=1631968 RepID=A0AA48HZG0_9ALTE|nr:hypothetical protein MACH26_42040 [Planctobacterium marinum]